MKQADLRKAMIEKRSRVSGEEGCFAAAEIARRVLALPEILRAETVMVYLPVRGELSTLPLIAELKKAGKKICYPVTVGKDMLAALPQTEGFIKGDFGVSVPETYTEIYTPNVVIVPLSVADTRRFRVGYGKGFYDKFWGERTAFSVGVCYDFQVVETLPQNPWEKPLNALVTERRILR